MDNTDLDFDLGKLFENDDITITQLDSLQTQELIKVNVPTINNERFGSVRPVTDTELSHLKTDRIPKGTWKQNCWAMSCYADWAKWRNQQNETLLSDHSAVPVDLATQSLANIDYWMSRFIVECRRKDGHIHPPNTLYNITTSIQRALREEHGRHDVRMLDDNDPAFSEFRKSLDSRMKLLTAAGIGIHRERADPISIDDECRLWDQKVIALDSAKCLSYGVFFYNCKVFGFRGDDEHKHLDVDQYTITNQSGLKVLTFRGRSSKNVQGGLKQRRVEPKIIKQFQNENNPRCIVSLFEKYLSCVPSSGAFYRKPMPNKSKDMIYFSIQCIGVNTLSKYMSSMFNDAGIDTSGRNIRNHSGKVTLCTRMYQENYDEQAIMARSGHRSTAVRDYKRPSLALLQQVSNTLQPPLRSATATSAPQSPLLSASVISSPQSLLRSATVTSETQPPLSSATVTSAPQFPLRLATVTQGSQLPLRSDPVKSEALPANATGGRIEIVVPECINTVVINRNGKKVTITL